MNKLTIIVITLFTFISTNKTFADFSNASVICSSWDGYANVGKDNINIKFDILIFDYSWESNSKLTTTHSFVFMDTEHVDVEYWSASNLYDEGFINSQIWRLNSSFDPMSGTLTSLLDFDGYNQNFSIDTALSPSEEPLFTTGFVADLVSNKYSDVFTFSSLPSFKFIHKGVNMVSINSNVENDQVAIELDGPLFSHLPIKSFNRGSCYLYN